MARFLRLDIEDIYDTGFIDRGNMTGEIIAILAVGATLLGLVWRMIAGVGGDIRGLRGDVKDLNARLGRVEGTLGAMDNRLVALEGRLAHLENRLDVALSSSR